MSTSKKRATIVALAMGMGVGVGFPAVAQTTQWTGWSAQAGLGYQSIKHQFDQVVSEGADMAVTASTAGSLVGKVGLDYTWALNASYVLAAGVDLGLNDGKASDFSAVNQTTNAAESGQIKFRQGVGVSLAPGVLVDKDTLAYFKLGYLSTTVKWEDGNSKETGKGLTYGLGAKFLQGNDYFFYTELKYLAGKKKSMTADVATTGNIQSTGYVMSVGVGKRF